MKIAVCTMYSDSYAEIAALTVPVMKDYCEKRGYEFHHIKCPDWNYNYVKHEYFQDLLQTDIAALLYIDADALVTQSVPIESFLDDEHDFYIAEDIMQLNGGVFILRNSMWAKAFNDFVLEQRTNFVNEQEVYVAYKDTHILKSKIKILPQSMLNSYDYSLYPECKNRVGGEGDWKPGDFIFHVPALTISQRIEAIKKHIQ